MRTYLPTLFVILLSVFAAVMSVQSWQVRSENTQLAAQQQSLLADISIQVSFRKQVNDDLLGAMLEEIEEEIQNENKLTNQGLADTIQAVHERLESLLEEPSLNQAQLDAFGDFLREIYAFNHIDQESLGLLTLSEPFPPFLAQQRLILLEWEQTLLESLNMRLGMIYFYGSYSQVTILPQALPEVKVGDDFGAELLIKAGGWSLPQSNNITHEVSMGKVTYRRHRKERTAWLTIPTTNLLPAGEDSRLIRYTVHTTLPKVTGGFSVMETEGEFRLVRD